MHKLRLDSRGRRKIKYCPCDKDNRDGKFTPFFGHDKYGHCHSCGETKFPPTKSDATPVFQAPRNQIIKPLPITTISDSILDKKFQDPGNSNFIKWLSNDARRQNEEYPFTMEQVRYLIDRYRIKGSNVYSNGVAFIYTDINGKTRQIKVMGYDVFSGKRIKGQFPQIMQLGKKLSEEAGITNANIVSCFYGEHLLAGNSMDVNLFESEATAIYASLFFMDSVCLATGGKNGCKWDSAEQIKVLRGHKITLWPDIDAHDEWTEKAIKLAKGGIAVNVSQFIPQVVKNQVEANGIPYDEFKAMKFDLRDILIFKIPKNKQQPDYGDKRFEIPERQNEEENQVTQNPKPPPDPEANQLPKPTRYNIELINYDLNNGETWEFIATRYEWRGFENLEALKEFYQKAVQRSGEPGRLDERDKQEEIFLDFKSIAVEKPIRFSTDEYTKWFQDIDKPRSVIDLEPDLQITNIEAFVTGQLNHIRAYTNYREPGNRSKYIFQLQKLRNYLTT